jgi:hypothetical protein
VFEENSNNTALKDVWKPEILNLVDRNLRERYQHLIETNPQLQALDEIEGQLKELLKLRHPSRKLSDEELHHLISDHLGGIDPLKYGNWVYYPWLNQLVHVLPEDEFVEVRTNRNQYKITPGEEDILAQKKIGVVGLSVGKAIALTIAMERICGSMVLADFDEIELSNLNRIQTGIQNFGLKKTVVVAREIAEIDPYLKVNCLHDGLNESNMDHFFTGHGKLDICIEVCDGLATKITARQRAKELGIAVVMNSSDNGSTDIERFDLDPNLPILHGLVDHLDLDQVHQAKTNEEKIPYLLPMLGLETSSERLKASMMEIEQTITTWPQLASGVALGGGICADVCRRILLGTFTKSGRYIVDLEQAINDDVVDHIALQRNANTELNYAEAVDQFNQSIDEAYAKTFHHHPDSIDLTKDQIRELVSAAILAPSGGNVQPWKWVYRDRHLLLFSDNERGKSVLNHNNSATKLTLGAASENLILKAHELGIGVTLEQHPLGYDNELIATFRFTHKEEITNDAHDTLVSSISNRLTNRTITQSKPLPPDSIQALTEIVNSVNGAEVQLFTNRSVLDQFKKILAATDTAFMTNRAGHSHFMSELRWTEQEVTETKDGIDLDTIDLTPSERAGLHVAKNWNVTKHLKKWRLGNEFGGITRKIIDHAAALGVITMPRQEEVDYFNGGRAMERLWLKATELGISLQPISMSTYLFTKIEQGDYSQMEDIKDDVMALYNQFKEVAQLQPDRKDVFFFRLAYAPEPEVKALRRDVDSVLSIED